MLSSFGILWDCVKSSKVRRVCRASLRTCQRACLSSAFAYSCVGVFVGGCRWVGGVGERVFVFSSVCCVACGVICQKDAFLCS